MSMEFRKEVLDKLCANFNQSIEEIQKLCDFLRNDLKGKDEIQYDGKIYTVETKVTFLGKVIESLFLYEYFHMIEEMKGQHMYSFMKQYIKKLVESKAKNYVVSSFKDYMEREIHDSYKNTDSETKNWADIYTIESIHSTNVLLERVVTELFLGTNLKQPIIDGESFNEFHSDLYEYFVGEPPKKDLPFYYNEKSYREQWNAWVKDMLKEFIERELAEVAELVKTEGVKNKLYDFIDAYDFTWEFRLKELKDIFKTKFRTLVKTGTKLVNKKLQKLTDEQIAMILDPIKYTGVYPTVRMQCEKKVKDKLEIQLRKIKMDPKDIPKLIDIVEKKFEKARVKTKYKAGAIASQALGENASQAGLRSFHHAGISGASGFDRIEELTQAKNVEGKDTEFTTIALKGQPTFAKVQEYSNLIQETYVKDICTMEIGRTSPDVPNIITLDVNDQEEEIGNAPIFIAEPGGWQEKYMEFHLQLSAKEDNKKRPTERPKWILRLNCNRDEMYQRRISMKDLANAIEDSIDQCRVIISNIAMGIVEIYPGNPGEVLPGDFEGQHLHSFIALTLMPTVEQVMIKGIKNFTKTIIEKTNIVTFIHSVNHSSEGFIVNFTRDVINHGVPKSQIVKFLSEKAGLDSSIHMIENKMKWEVKGSSFKHSAEFTKRLRTPTYVTFTDMIQKVVEGDDILEIYLDRDLIRKTHNIEVQQFYELAKNQNDLGFHISVNISFDRKDFKIIVRKESSFNAKTVVDILCKDPVIGKLCEEAKVETETQFSLPLTSDNAHQMDYIINLYSGSISSTIENGRVIFTLKHLPLQDVLSNMKSFKGNDTKMISRSIEHNSLRYRIMSKGISTLCLAKRDFVNIYATFPSVPMEYFNFFDVEVAKQYIFNELVFNAGGDVGGRHLSLLTSTLTYIGRPISAKITGKRATNVGPIATASFQELLKQTLEASSSNSFDTLTSAAGMTLIGDLHRTMQDEKNLNIQKEESALDILMKASEDLKERPKYVSKVRKERVKENEFKIEKNYVDDNIDEFASGGDFL